MSDPTECPKCGGPNFSICSYTFRGEVMYRILECRDCYDAQMKKMVDEIIENNPKVATAYAKTKLRTDYYGTVTIKDDNET